MKKQEERVSGKFGFFVFTRDVMEKMLPREVKQNLYDAMDGLCCIKEEYADIIAVAMKEWAVAYDATHYCHWFQPLSGETAEKHDSFISWKTSDTVIEHFNGLQLVQGEPDASSFPSGGLRSTYEARGYTGWDPTSHVFIWKSGSESTLFIPSVFYSWTGEVLDNKIPLLRSDSKINDSVLRLLKLTGNKAKNVFSVLGWEQEYFVIERALKDKRSDLVMLGRTIYGNPPAKGQHLQDHYFGAVKDRILTYMKECEERALELGIPVKTRHNEVAPAQHEFAIVHEKASRGVDHNLLMMEIMRQVAVKHNLACLLQEKPFAGINGSGKHNNWSLSTDDGVNLFDPTDTPEDSLQFLIILTSVLYGIHENAILLRSSIGSLSNDERLGSHEAPPAIISVYLGEVLENLLESIEEESILSVFKGSGKVDLGILTIPHLPKGNTDRNRTSPFAFTGDKFEFRAVGSSQNCAFPITVLNVIFADALSKILDDIEGNLKGKTKKALAEAALPVLRKYLKASKNIRFSGDSYSKEWAEEAEKRKLPNVKRSLESFKILKDEKTISIFDGVLNKTELECRYEVEVEKYCKSFNIQISLMLELFYTKILPVALEYQKKVADSVTDKQASFLKKVQDAVSMALYNGESLEKSYKEEPCCSDVLFDKCFLLRQSVDALEKIIDDKLWPLPKYWELLFLL